MYSRYRVALRTLGSQEGHARWFRKDGTSTRGSAVSQDPFLPQLSNKVKDISWLLKVKFVHMRNKRLCWNRCCYEAFYIFILWSTSRAVVTRGHHRSIPKWLWKRPCGKLHLMLGWWRRQASWVVRSQKCWRLWATLLKHKAWHFQSGSGASSFKW